MADADCFWCRVGEVALALLVVMYAGCYFRVFPAKVMRVWFAFVAIVNVLIMASTTFVVDLVLYLGVSRKWTRVINSLICRVTFAGIVYGNPQVRIKMDKASWEVWCSIPLRSALALNHTSFWDAFLFVGLTPWTYVYNAKTLMKDSLKKIPIFGSIFDRVGHFPVYFKSDEDGNFSVDKERQAPVMINVQRHLDTGGRICFFPEGAVNKAPKTLKSFRRGSFAIILENKLPLYYYISVGNEDTWPASAPLGGLAADIYVSVHKFDIDFTKDTAETVAERLQVAMQAELDRLYALRESDRKSKRKSG